MNRIQLAAALVLTAASKGLANADLMAVPQLRGSAAVAIESSSYMLPGTSLLSLEEQEFMAHELEWAEHNIELYRRRNKQLPLRSSIRADHVNSEDWKQDSMDALQQQLKDTQEILRR